MSTKKGLLELASFRGRVIPDRSLNAWVCHSYHPSYILRGNTDLEHIFELDFSVFASMVGKPRPSFSLHDENIRILYTFDEVMEFLDDIWVDPFSFDYETSSYRYHEGIHTVHLISVAMSKHGAVSFPYDFKKSDGTMWWTPGQIRTIGKLWKEKLKSNCPKSAQNMKHEEKCSRAIFGVGVENWDWDTMLAAHILNESPGTKGLKTQVYMEYGFHYGSDTKPFLEAAPGKRNRFEEMPIEESGKYCGRDSLFTHRIAKKQKRLIRVQGLQRAYDLFHDGALAFAEMEMNGIRIDMPLAEQWDKEWGDELAELKEGILTSDDAKKFEKKIGRPLNYQKKLSGKDLQILLFDILKIKHLAGTERKTGWAVD